MATERTIESKIERAAVRINALATHSALQLALGIGQAIVDELYDGDLSQWRERGPKEHSLRRLAYSERLLVSSSALYRSLAVYELRVRLGPGPAWERLSLGHFRALIGLPEPVQRQMLSSCLDAGWSCTELERQVAGVRVLRPPSKGGRPRKPRFLRSIERATAAMSDEDDVFGDLDVLACMNDERREQLVGKLALIRQRCDELTAMMEA